MTHDRDAPNNPLEHLLSVADQFKPDGRITGIQPWGSGNVNDTFLVTLDTKIEKHFILQRINTRVFRRPELIMANIRVVTEHARRRIQDNPIAGAHTWKMVRVLPTRGNRDFWKDAKGSFWRAISFIEGAQSFDTIQDVEHAREVGIALGWFHSLVSDLSSTRLADTLEGFHITPRYLLHLDKILAGRRVANSPEAEYCLQFVKERRNGAGILEEARAEGKLHPRPIHGDPKVNNILMDTRTRRAISIVDLDTVKPGLIHYDIGDCLRSACNPLGEETQQWETVRFEPALCRAILEGYLSRARRFLTEADHEYLYDAIRLIAFELGLRFLTDYLEGNVYFKASHEEHNLRRALVQFKLTESIESQAETIRRIMEDVR